MKEHIYTGTLILTNRLAFSLNEVNIPSIIKDHKESGRLAGFGALENSVELFIINSDIKKVSSILEIFKKEVSK